MASHFRRVEGIEVSCNFIADLWRDNDLQPHRTGTFEHRGVGRPAAERGPQQPVAGRYQVDDVLAHHDDH